MRIIAGTAKGRRLAQPPPKSDAIRPTADRAREALFSIIGSRIRGARVLDLFCGTGAVGLEALSRGAESAVFVDQSASAITLVKKNIDLCGFKAQSLTFRRDLGRGLIFLRELGAGSSFDLVFLDPPYGKGISEKVMAGLLEAGLLSEEPLVVAEERTGIELSPGVGELVLTDRRRYGDSTFWFYCLLTDETV